MDSKFLSGLGKIRIVRIVNVCIGRGLGPSNLSGLEEKSGLHMFGL